MNIECDLEDSAFIAVAPVCLFLLPLSIALSNPSMPLDTTNLISWINIPLSFLSRIAQRFS